MGLCCSDFKGGQSSLTQKGCRRFRERIKSLSSVMAKYQPVIPVQAGIHSLDSVLNYNKKRIDNPVGADLSAKKYLRINSLLPDIFLLFS